jgi:hypothetical protein
MNSKEEVSPQAFMLVAGNVYWQVHSQAWEEMRQVCYQGHEQMRIVILDQVYWRVTFPFYVGKIKDRILGG